MTIAPHAEAPARIGKQVAVLLPDTALPLGEEHTTGTDRISQAGACKPVILTFSNGYLPGFRSGGPARSLANLVGRLGDEFDFRIVCMDRDFGEGPYAGITPDTWTKVGKARVFYTSPHGHSWLSLRRLLRDTPHDVLYVNSFFHPVFTLRPLILRALRLAPRRPVVVAPRGEFSPGALRIKDMRKRVFIALARRTGLYAGARWQASTAQEAEEIQLGFGAASKTIHVACDIVTPLAATAIPATTRMDEPTHTGTRPLRVCFLSRISPKKNLDFALRVLRRAKLPIDFEIYGPTEDVVYWNQCQSLIATLPNHVSARHLGAVAPTQVRETIAAYDVFFVPSHGENFGHVFVEAWSAGVPVLVSDCTPWHGLQDKNIGWNLPLSEPDRFVSALESRAQMTQAQVAAMRQACFAFAREQADAPTVIEANRRLFLYALGVAQQDA